MRATTGCAPADARLLEGSRRAAPAHELPLTSSRSPSACHELPLSSPGTPRCHTRGVSPPRPPRPPLTTTERRLGTGVVLRAGSTAPYRAVTIVEGEPHLVRDDVGAAGISAEGEARAGRAGSAAGRPGRPLLCLVHLTDLQLADVQSPTRC